MKYILFILFVILGLFMIIKPDVYWNIEHKWNIDDILYVKNVEPTDLALPSIKRRGVFIIIVGVILVIFA